MTNRYWWAALPRVVGGQAGEAGQPHAVALLVDLQGVVLEIAAQHGGEAGQAAFRPRMLGAAGAGAVVPSRSRAKPTLSWAMAWRLISSVMAMASERSDFMNFSRAGVA